jgi:HAD superfamily hydrolase (TIGR01509 family)
MSELGPLLRGVELLCLDAGNTIVFLDHARVASLCAGGPGEPFPTTAEALRRAEGEAKYAHEQGRLLDFAWAHADLAAARGWAQMVGTTLAFAGLAPARVASRLDALWAQHCARNLWSLVPEGLVPALAGARAAGVPIAVVSNSEGTLEALFEDLGILRSFDLVLDSGVVGIEKPDPRIFAMALDRFHVPAHRALHLGDNFATDVLGARAAGIPVALIDPFHHLAGRHADVPRVPGAREVAEALAGSRGYSPARA